MVTRMWLWYQDKRATSLVPALEEIADSRAFVRRLFEEYYKEPRNAIKQSTSKSAKPAPEKP